MILERDLSHMGSALAHAVLAGNIPLASLLLADAGVDPNDPRMYGRQAASDCINRISWDV